MKNIYKYIFYKAYHFCINTFKEKEFPWMFATGAISIAFVASIIMVLELVEYIMLPKKINTFGEYHGYFSLGALICAAFLIKKNDSYLKILRDVDLLSTKKKKSLGALSLVYIFFVFTSLFYLAYLIRRNTY
jgi:hypothetical protein